jgi:hypothetical protein
VALLVVAGLLGLATWFPRQRHCIAVGLVAANALVAMIQFDVNRNVVRLLEPTLDPQGRANLETALMAGVADRVPDGATIMTTAWHPWLCNGPPLSSGLFTQCLRRPVFVVNGDVGPHKARTLKRQLEKPLGAWSEAPSLPAPSYFTVERSLNRKDGYVLVGSLESSAEDCEDKSPGTRNFRIFLRGSFTAGESLDRTCVAGSPLLAECEAEDSIPQLPTPDRISLRQLTLLKAGAGWALFEGSFPRIVDVNTVVLQSVSEAAGDVAAPHLGTAGPGRLAASLERERP